MSAVILIVEEDDVAKVEKYVAASVHIRKWVDVHLYYATSQVTGEAHIEYPEEAIYQGDATVLGKKLLYPANLMRNMAVEQARTEWIMTVEVDLAFGPGASAILAGVVQKVMDGVSPR